MIDEMQRIEFWGTHNPDTNKKKQNMVALINKVYYTNNDTILCIDGWINYNGEIFETTKPLLKINLKIYLDLCLSYKRNKHFCNLYLLEYYYYLISV